MDVQNASAIGSIQPLSSESTHSLPTKEVGEQSFSKLIGELVQDANTTHLEAEDTTRELMAGNVDNIHDVVLKVAKADLSFRFLMEIRNKVTEAYQEISRMPL